MSDTSIRSFTSSGSPLPLGYFSDANLPLGGTPNKGSQALASRYSGGNMESVKTQIREYEAEKQKFQEWLNQLPFPFDALGGLVGAVGHSAVDLLYYGETIAPQAVLQGSKDLLAKFGNKPKEWTEWVNKNFGGWKDHNALDPRRGYYDYLIANPPKYVPGNGEKEWMSQWHALDVITSAMAVNFSVSTFRKLKDLPPGEAAGKLWNKLANYVASPLNPDENPNLAFGFTTSALRVVDMVNIFSGATKGLGWLAMRGLKVGAKSAQAVFKQMKNLLVRGEKLIASNTAKHPAELQKAMREVVEAAATDDAGRIERSLAKLEAALKAEAPHSKASETPKPKPSKKNNIVPFKREKSPGKPPDDVVRKVATDALENSKAPVNPKSDGNTPINGSNGRGLTPAQQRDFDQRFGSSSNVGKDKPTPPSRQETPPKLKDLPPQPGFGEPWNPVKNANSPQEKKVIGKKSPKPGEASKRVTANSGRDELRQVLNLPNRPGNQVDYRTLNELDKLLNQKAVSAGVSPENLRAQWSMLDPGHQASSLGVAVLRARKGLNGLSAGEMKNLETALLKKLDALAPDERMPFVKGLIGEGWKDFYQANRGGHGAGAGGPGPDLVGAGAGTGGRGGPKRNNASGTAQVAESPTKAHANVPVTPSVLETQPTLNPKLGDKKASPTVASTGQPTPLDSIPGRMTNHLNEEFGAGGWEARANGAGGFDIYGPGKGGTKTKYGKITREEDGKISPGKKYEGRDIDSVKFVPEPGSIAQPKVVHIFREDRRGPPVSQGHDEPTQLNPKPATAEQPIVAQYPPLLEDTVILQRNEVSQRVKSSIEVTGHEFEGQRKISLDVGRSKDGTPISVDIHIANTDKKTPGAFANYRVRFIQKMEETARRLAVECWETLRRSPEAAAYATKKLNAAGQVNTELIPGLVGKYKREYAGQHIAEAVNKAWGEAFADLRTTMKKVDSEIPPLVSKRLLATTSVTLGLGTVGWLGYNTAQVGVQGNRVAGLDAPSSQFNYFNANPDFLFTKTYATWQKKAIADNPANKQYFYDYAPFGPKVGLWESTGSPPKQSPALASLLNATRDWRAQKTTSVDVAEGYAYTQNHKGIKNYIGFVNDPRVKPYVTPDGDLKPEFFADPVRIDLLKNNIAQTNLEVFFTRVQCRYQMAGDNREQVGKQVREIEIARAKSNTSNTDSANAITSEWAGMAGIIGAISAQEKAVFDGVEKSAAETVTAKKQSQENIQSEYSKDANAKIQDLTKKLEALNGGTPYVNPEDIKNAVPNGSVKGVPSTNNPKSESGKTTDLGNKRTESDLVRDVEQQVAIVQQMSALTSQKLAVIDGEIARLQKLGAAVPSSMKNDRSQAQKQIADFRSLVASLKASIPNLKQSQTAASNATRQNAYQAQRGELASKKPELQTQLDLVRAQYGQAQTYRANLESTRSNNLRPVIDNQFAGVSTILGGATPLVNVIQISGREFLVLDPKAVATLKNRLTPDTKAIFPANLYNDVYDVEQGAAKPVPLPLTVPGIQQIKNAQESERALLAQFKRVKDSIKDIDDKIQALDRAYARGITNPLKPTQPIKRTLPSIR